MSYGGVRVLVEMPIAKQIRQKYLAIYPALGETTTSSASIHQEPRYCDAFSKSVGKNRDDRGETTLIIEGIVEGINQS